LKVTAPDGTRWQVGRQWWPERGRDPWTVRARTDGRTYHRWHVVGFRNSGERRDEVAAALGSGRALPPANPLPR
jgi:hypothetical protein